MFKITDRAITSSPLQNPQAGAMVSFEGWVRNHNEGRQVSSLEYQCYQSMAVKEGEKILSEAREKYPILDVFAVHREGHLQIGEIAVQVDVLAAHRKEAFESCQYIIDEIKRRVPIWKKEYYVDGPAEWVACHRCKNGSV